MIEKTKTFFVVLIYLNIVYCSEILLNEIILKTDLEFKKHSLTKFSSTCSIVLTIVKLSQSRVNISSKELNFEVWPDLL